MAKDAVRLMAVTETGKALHIVALTEISGDGIGVYTLCGLVVSPRLLIDLETPLCDCARCKKSLKRYGNAIGYTDASK